MEKQNKTSYVERLHNRENLKSVGLHLCKNQQIHKGRFCDVCKREIVWSIDARESIPF
jgi:hypothetical protein